MQPDLQNSIRRGFFFAIKYLARVVVIYDDKHSSLMLKLPYIKFIQRLVYNGDASYKLRILKQYWLIIDLTTLLIAG